MRCIISVSPGRTPGSHRLRTVRPEFSLDDGQHAVDFRQRVGCRVLRDLHGVSRLEPTAEEWIDTYSPYKQVNASGTQDDEA